MESLSASASYCALLKRCGYERIQSTLEEKRAEEGGETWILSVSVVSSFASRGYTNTLTGKKGRQAGILTFDNDHVV